MNVVADRIQSLLGIESSGSFGRPRPFDVERSSRGCCRGSPVVRQPGARTRRSLLTTVADPGRRTRPPVATSTVHVEFARPMRHATRLAISLLTVTVQRSRGRPRSSDASSPMSPLASSHAMADFMWRRGRSGVTQPTPIGSASAAHAIATGTPARGRSDQDAGRVERWQWTLPPRSTCALRPWCSVRRPGRSGNSNARQSAG